MNLEEQLRDLIDLAPPHIQRHFACDCAERALRRAKVKDKRSWKAIEISRRFAEGKATSDELEAARDAAWAAWAARDAAWATARDAAWAAAWVAAQNTAWATTRNKEREWQIEHLQSLIAAHNAARSSLLYILQQRAETLRPTFTQYARTLEERVFE